MQQLVLPLIHAVFDFLQQHYLRQRQILNQLPHLELCTPFQAVVLAYWKQVLHPPWLLLPAPIFSILEVELESFHQTLQGHSFETTEERCGLAQTQYYCCCWIASLDHD